MPSEGVPKLNLPVHVNIVRHAGEPASKSSIIPLKIISPDDVSIFKYHPVTGGTLPELDPTESVILYPSEDASDVSDIDWSTVNNLLVIDSTWTQTKSILDSIGHESFRKVRLSPSYKTQFWRYQTGKSDNCLATAEAIYLLLRDAYKFPGLDDLLWFYGFSHSEIQHRSVSQKLPGMSNIKGVS